MNVRTPARPARLRAAPDALAPLGSVLQEQDTRRVDLAHRLHRDVAGGLVACASMSEMIRHELRQTGDNEGLAKMFASLEATLRQTIQVVRDLTGEQLPAVLKTFGLVGALEQLAEGAGSPVELTVSGTEPSLPLSQRLCLHQLVQVLIDRINRHANSSKIELICMFEPARMEILIEHDGRDVMHAVSADDTTLATIRGRISHLGGRLLLTRNAGESLRRVRLVLPLPITTAKTPSPNPQTAAIS
jgi:signal transduction histidine kinase